jgi:transcriptional regulator with XRE-family HTH domain
MSDFHMAPDYHDPVRHSQQHLDCVLHQNPDMTFLSDRLRNEREMQKLTQHELAQKSGCGQSIIGNLESGKQETTKYMPHIAKALGLETIWLQDGVGPKYLDKNQEVNERNPEDKTISAAFSAEEKIVLDGYRLATPREKELILHIAKKVIEDFNKRSEKKV